MFGRKIVLLIVVTATLAMARAEAEDAFYHMPISQLSLEVMSSTPTLKSAGGNNHRNWQYTSQMRDIRRPYGILDGEGEIYVDCNNARFMYEFGEKACTNGTISIRSVPGKPPQGRLVLPNEGEGMSARSFKIDPSKANQALRADFLIAKKKHYTELQNRNISGAAYFRFLADQAREQVSGKEPPLSALTAQQRRMQSTLNDPIDRSYHLLSGGRALSENIQLDRVLLPLQGKNETEDISLIEGITVQSFNWKEMLGSEKPKLDLLSAFIPEDQYALFFKSFQDMVNLVDEAKNDAAPVLETLETRAEQARTQERYEAQLALSLTGFVRLMGSHIIQSVAFSGSDPYLRTGSDVALLLETKDPELLFAFVKNRYTQETSSDKTVKLEEGEIHGTRFSAIRNPSRTRSSYVAAVDNVIIVSNSLFQLRRIIESNKGIIPSMQKLEEYAFFRTRYPRPSSDESALLIVTDGAIRKWCGPKWRIGASRRTLAAALLSDLQAKNIQKFAYASPLQQKLSLDPSYGALGEVTLGNNGVHSEKYGNLDFLTPISELSIPRVTPEEKTEYIRYRDQYQQQWRRFFDPIAVKFTVDQRKVGFDMTVMPLIIESDYTDLMEISRGVALKPDSGDPHEEALLHFALALNPNSHEVQKAGGFMSMLAPSLTNPLGWVGSSLAVYLDSDTFWDDLQRAKEPDTFIEKTFHRFPIGLHVEVSDGLKLAAFLTTLRSYIEQTSPGLTVWESLKYRDKGYIKIGAARANNTNAEPGWALYYAVTPKSFLLTLSESLLKRALDRLSDSPSLSSDKSLKSTWLGDSVALKINKGILYPLQSVIGQSYTNQAQLRCWSNLPILNEWRRLFSDKNPIAAHEVVWKTKLVCPAGGTYIWNESWQTYESSIFGHPAEPRGEKVEISQIKNITDGNFGLTFEENGLRAKVEFRREEALVQE